MNMPDICLNPLRHSYGKIYLLFYLLGGRHHLPSILILGWSITHVCRSCLGLNDAYICCATREDPVALKDDVYLLVT